MKQSKIKFEEAIYKPLQAIAGAMGFNLVVTKRSKVGDYELVSPSATYAPWLSDKLFNNSYNTIKNYTLVDKHRCYELWQLVKECTKLKGSLIEIGTWKGGSASLIAKQAQLCGIKEKVYLCDTFTGVVKVGKEDLSYEGGEHADTSKELVEAVVHKLGVDNIEVLEGVFPDETGKLVSNKLFCFCHIDVDVYQSAKDVLNWIWDRLVIGGIVVFDDYGFERCSGVTQLVNEERSKKDRLVIHNLNGHAIFIKLK